jgi:hypothetical protein
MAVRGKPLPVGTILLIQRLGRNVSIRQTARMARVDRNTARKYLRGAWLLDRRRTAGP